MTKTVVEMIDLRKVRAWKRDHWIRRKKKDQTQKIQQGEGDCMENEVDVQ